MVSQYTPNKGINTLHKLHKGHCQCTIKPAHFQWRTISLHRVSTTTCILTLTGSPQLNVLQGACAPCSKACPGGFPTQVSGTASRCCYQQPCTVYTALAYYHIKCLLEYKKETASFIFQRFSFIHVHQRWNKTHYNNTNSTHTWNNAHTSYNGLVIICRL